MRPEPPPRTILSIRDLTVNLNDATRSFPVIDRMSLEVPKGQTVALLGESGSGKTLAALAVLGLLPKVAAVASGSVEFEGVDLLELDDAQLQKYRGNRIGMIFQEPGTSLNPVMQVGRQIGESMRIHKGLGARSTRQQVLALMEMVGIPDPRRRYRVYPHQLSGGVRQRVVIAMALACRPELLLADEPTTALDATVQAQIVDLLARLIRDLRMSVLLISHDLGVVASLADRVAVLHGGRVVEEGSVRALLNSPRHPYTRALLEARPTGGTRIQEEQLVALRGSSPSRDGGALGCTLGGVCPNADERCRVEDPRMIRVAEDHRVRCFVAELGDG